MRRSAPLRRATLVAAALVGTGTFPLPLLAQGAPAVDPHAAHHAPAAPRAARATVVLLVRHAEKAAAPADDPGLSEAGLVRARDLADAVRAAGVSAVVVSPRVRTRATAQVLLDDLGLAPEVVPLDGGVATHARAVADAVRRHAGETVLVVGHSNTVPAIVAALGGPSSPDLCDAEYSNLFVLVLQPPAGEGTTPSAPSVTPDAAARLVRTHYGRPDDPAAVRACAPMTPR